MIHVAGVLRESLQPEELFYRETADNFGMLMRLMTRGGWRSG